MTLKSRENFAERSENPLVLLDGVNIKTVENSKNYFFQIEARCAAKIRINGTVTK